MSAKRRSFLTHLHPPVVRPRSLRPAATLGLGIAALTCLGVLLVTGLTLFLYYVPDPDLAYERVLHITTTLHFGGVIRNLHYLAANALVVLAWLHLARVFLTGSYLGRGRNWLYGLGLLLLILLGNFTGYLLPWDQISYWAMEVGANLAGTFPLAGGVLRAFLLGGEEIGGETLLRAFALHAGAVPLGLTVLAALHLWRIRRDGGLAAPPEAEVGSVPADPWLFRAEGAVALLTLALLIGLALVVDAPLFERADPQHPPNPAKAPWYFVGIQEMVSHSAFLGGVAAPAALALFFLLTPLLDRGRAGGRWFSRDRAGLNLVFLALMLSQVLFIVLGQWFRGRNWQWIWPFP